MAGRLAGQRLGLVQSSPRRRARRTAEAITGQSGAPLEITPALDEIDFGEWTGLTFDKLEGQTLWRDWNERRGSTRCPGGESMAEAADRIADHAAGLARRHPGTRIAFVAHADVLRGLIARVLGLPLDNILRFEIAPASVSRIEIGDWGGRVLSLNETVEEEWGS